MLLKQLNQFNDDWQTKLDKENQIQQNKLKEALARKKDSDKNRPRKGKKSWLQISKINSTRFKAKFLRVFQATWSIK